MAVEKTDLLETDIEAYLKQHENKELLRFITCGSVDDGKSTLIGRLLHDSKMIFEDQLAAINKDSKKHGTTGEEVDLALLVDGLQSEREQGITIDVAYRFFATDKRKFIIADTPGHEQYTRNMATGASTADLAIILIDARHGVQTQTRRHSYITSLLGIKNIVIAVNKMDLVNYSQAVFENIVKEYTQFLSEIGVIAKTFIPVSGREGDGIAKLTEKIAWYQGQTVLDVLDDFEKEKPAIDKPFRMPVQDVYKFTNMGDSRRIIAGTVEAGSLKVGDEVVFYPSGKRSRVKTFEGFNTPPINAASVGEAVGFTLDEQIYITRGEIATKGEN
jgi:sulfate adenylyltransferase subunit 1